MKSQREQLPRIHIPLGYLSNQAILGPSDGKILQDFTPIRYQAIADTQIFRKDRLPQLKQISNDMSSLSLLKTQNLSKDCSAQDLTQSKKKLTLNLSLEQDTPTYTSVNNSNPRQVQRPRIVSIPIHMTIQSSEVEKNKHHILNVLSTRNNDTTFVAFHLKPNLALLRNRGIYHLNKAEDNFNISLERRTKVINHDIEKPSAFFKKDLVKVSQMLLNRSQSILAASEQEEIYDQSPRISRKLSRQDGMIKIMQQVQSPRRTRKITEPAQQQHAMQPINRKFYKAMKRRIRQKKYYDKINQQAFSP